MMSSQSGSGFGVGVNREALERELGLDVPWYVQYVRWMAGVFRGDLGESFRGQSPVTDEILPRLPVTLELGFFAMLISVITALPVGIYSAIRQDTLGDYMGRGIAIVFISVPLFWTATMVMIYPALWWGWSPPGTHPFRERPAGPSGDVYHSGHCDGVVPFGNHYSNDAHHDAGSPAARLYPDGLVKKRGQIFFRFIQGLNVG